MTNLQECLTYLSDIDFNGPTIRAAREELAELTQRANRLGMTSADVERAATPAWNEAVEACARTADATYQSIDEGARVVAAIRALKRTT